MKKYIIALLVIVILSNCEISPVKVEAKQDIGADYSPNANVLPNLPVWYEIVVINNVKYLVFSRNNGGGIVIVNTIKDSLECEYYKQHIK